MKALLALAVLAATLGGCAIVPLDYGYRGDRGYYREGYRDGYYRDRYRGYYRDDYYGYRRNPYADHGQ